MFTGIIKAVGIIREVDDYGGDRSLVIDTGILDTTTIGIGDSISINGVCLTVVSFDANSIRVDVSAETIACTALAEYGVGKRVNLEQAMQAGARFDGHIVSGHVDCVATIESIIAEARSIRYRIQVPVEYRRYLCKKGSVCIDGVSLTVNSVTDAVIDVNIIPHTAEQTVFKDYVTGSRVNLEVDIVARYLESLYPAVR